MNPTEEVEQRNFVQWLEARGYKYTAIPNSTYTRSWSQKRKNHEMGLRPGFPDLVVIANNQFMCIEMKRTKGGVVSATQVGWIKALQEAGIPTRVCKGANDAITFVISVVGP